MEFTSQYLMLLHHGWSPLVIFSSAFAKEIKIHGGLKSQLFFSWDGPSGNHWNFLKRCHAQAKFCFSLGLNGNILLVLHFLCKLQNQSLSLPPTPFLIFYWLVSPSPRL
jgi:hypothetical protein